MITKIGIIGAGTMGGGIASCSALNGFDTYVYDVNSKIGDSFKVNIIKGYSKLVEKNKIDETKKKNAESKISFFNDINELKDCELIIEAAFEDINLKKELYSKLDEITSPETILATNTSSFSITSVASAVKNNNSRVIGMHFFNPANIMKLVEIVV